MPMQESSKIVLIADGNLKISKISLSRVCGFKRRSPKGYSRKCFLLKHIVTIPVQ